MNIHQLSVLFDERQDRLLMRVNTQEGEEVRLWLTRRIALKLVEPLQLTVAKMESRDAAIAAADAQTQALLVDLKQEDFLQKADLKTPFSTQSTNLPLGPEPLLVTEITLKVQGQAGAHIVFMDAGDERSNSRSCTLDMQAQLVHGLLHLLKNAIESAQWTSAPQASGAAAAGAHSADDDAPTTPPPKRIYTH
jgi:hypothetical protein